MAATTTKHRKTLVVFQDMKRLHGVAKFKVGDAVRYDTRRGVFLAGDAIGHVDGYSLDHTHGSVAGGGHTDDCYRPERIEYTVSFPGLTGRYHAHELVRVTNMERLTDAQGRLLGYLDRRGNFTRVLNERYQLVGYVDKDYTYDVSWRRVAAFPSPGLLLEHKK